MQDIGPRQGNNLTPQRKLRLFWCAFFRSWQGVVGLGIVMAFIVLAIGAPLLTPYHPLRDYELATSMARPAWMRIFPAYRNLPVTQEVALWGDIPLSDFDDRWIVDKTSDHGEIVTSIRTARVDEGEESVRFVWQRDFLYQHTPPHTLVVTVPYGFEGDSGVGGRVRLQLETARGQVFELWTSPQLREEVPLRAQRVVDSRDRNLAVRLGFSFFDNLASHLFAEPGTYTLRLVFEVDGISEDRSGTFYVGESHLRIPGDLHGPLGVDHIGSDLWSQWLYGARTSLWVGFVTAFIAVVIGTCVGVISGYWGGFLDELFMRIADVMLSIPVLPVMVVVAATVGKHMGNVIILLALFSWMGTARVVRSATLALRQQAFVEAARAAGATPLYIVWKHILPHTLGLVAASLVLLVPGAMIAESTLSFLGMGDPETATWGRMLHNARSFGAFAELAWWWILPPGLSITLLSIALLWVGNTVDDIFHRRMRMAVAARRDTHWLSYGSSS